MWQLMEKLQKFFDSSAPKTFEPKKSAAAAESTPDDPTSSGAVSRAQRLLDAHVEKQGTRRQRAAAARQMERQGQEQEQERERVARGGTAHAAAELAPDSLEQLKLQLEVAQSLADKNRHEQGRASERGANLGVDAETGSERDAHGESQPQGAPDAQEEEEQGGRKKRKRLHCVWRCKPRRRSWMRFLRDVTREGPSVAGGGPQRCSQRHRQLLERLCQSMWLGVVLLGLRMH